MKVNKQKQFYSHLVPMDEILIELGTTEMSAEEKTHLVTIIEQNMHYTVIDIILTNLPKDQHQQFLQHAYSFDHNTTWAFLNKHAKDIENKIIKATEELKNEFTKDIAEAKKQSKNSS